MKFGHFSLIAILLLALSMALPAQEQQAQGAMLGAELVKSSLQGNPRDAIELHGNSSIPADELLNAIGEQIREIHEQGLTPARGDDAAYYVGAYYRKRGFAKATVDYEIKGKKLVVRISEGPRSLLKKVVFTGNKSIPDTTLYDYMIGATPDRLAKEPEQFPYTESEVSAGADRVRGLYLSEGYLNVKVDTSGVELSDAGTRATVHVAIVEGIRYTFGKITFDGETIYPREQLVAALGDPVSGIAPKPDDVKRLKPKPAESSDTPFEGVSFSPGRTNAMQRNLQSFFKGQGYFTAEVAADTNYSVSTNGVVPVTFTVKPKGVYRFGGVELTNETARPRLDPSFLPKRFAILKGETYDPEKLDETYREMLRTGLFTTLRVSTVAKEDHEVTLEVTANEAKAKEVGFTIGYGSYEGATAGLRLADRDLFGLGRPLTFSVDYSQRGIMGELLYVDPWLFDSRFSLKPKIYSAARDEIGYSKQEFGGRVDLTRKVLPHLELGVFIEDSQTKISNEPSQLLDNPLLLGPTDYMITSLGITQLTDFRDNPTNPSRGLVVSSSFDYALLDGAPAFTRTTFRFSYYLPLGRTLLSFGARAGYIAPMIDSIPIDVRFFNGGGNTVRSFAERELGPEDKGGNPLGGDFYTVFNLEYTFPLYQALEGAVFVDAGSLRNEAAKEVDPSQVKGTNGDMRYAVGLGLRYRLPIGPLRLDYGINPDPKPNEDFGAFQFSFGFAF